MYSYKWFEKYQRFGVQTDPKNSPSIVKWKKKPDKMSDSSDSEENNSVKSDATVEEGLGEVMEKKTPRSSRKTDNNGPVSQTKVKKVLDTLRGQTVIARNSEDGLYYPGSVIRCTDSRHAQVKFLAIGKKTVRTRFVIPTGGAVARPVLRVGDYVLLRVMNFETKYDCFVPAIVRNTPMSETSQVKYYTVYIYSGQKASALRNHLVKISKARFTFAVRYLKDVQEDQESSNIEITPLQSDSEDEQTETETEREISWDNKKAEPDSTRENDSREESEDEPTNRKPAVVVKGNMEKAYTPKVPMEYLQEQKQRLDDLQHQLELQQREQQRQQRRLRKETRRLGKAQKKLAEDQKLQQKLTEERLLETQERLLKKQDELMDKYEKTKSLLETSQKDLPPDERTKLWVNNQPVDGYSSLVSPGRKEGEEYSKEMSIAWDPNHPTELQKKIRSERSKLRVGEEVVSRWSDEGWYYRGTVKQLAEKDAYFIEDSCGDIEKIWREDIITDDDDADFIIQVRDAVVGLHPAFAFSYCPGVVLRVYPDLWLLIRFYDGVEVRLPREEVYRIHAEKFEADVAYILKCEERWVGQAVVARDDNTGMYFLASVSERVGNGRQYVISWADGNLSIQTASAIFGAFTKRRPLAIGDHVLGIADKDRLVYLPGTIKDVRDKSLVVKYCDASKSKNVDPMQVFWLSQDYYDHAVAYYYSKGGRGSSAQQENQATIPES